MSDSPPALPPPASEPKRPARRFLTLLFADLSGSSQLAAELDAELYSQLLAQLHAIYASVVAAHGGVVAQIQGDGLAAIFGLPSSSEADGLNAARTALALRAAVAALPPPLPGRSLALHSGVHAGLVLLMDGDAVRGRYEMHGHATNVAAHLCKAAAAGEILVSEETLGPDWGEFEAVALELDAAATSSVAGLRVRRLLGLAAARHGVGAHRGRLPFIGREAELSVLAAALDRAAGGQAVVLLVEGSPGLGKTRLVEETAMHAAARGWQVHRGECGSAHQAEPMHALQQMLVRSAPGAAAAGADGADTAAANTSRALPGAVDAASPTREDASVAVEQVCARFVALAGQRPQLLVLDDLHLADDATWMAITRLRAAPSARLAVIACARPIDAAVLALSGFERLALDPLTEAQAQSAVLTLLPEANPFVASEIAAYAGGAPLFIEEICHAVAAQAGAGGAARWLSRLDGSGLAWLSVLIESRVAALPAELLHMLRVASVIGAVFPRALLAELVGDEALGAAEEPLRDRDLLFPGPEAGWMRFKHGITRDVVYAGLPLQERQALHARLVQHLLDRHQRKADGPLPVDMLAYHCAAAGDVAAASRHAERAGDEALRAAHLDRAQRAYREALKALDSLPADDEVSARWLAIVDRLGMACVFDPTPEQLPIFEAGLQRARRLGDAEATCRMLYWTGYVAYALGDQRRSVVHCRQALALAHGPRSEPLRVQIEATLGQALTANCTYPAAAAMLEPAIAVKRQHRSGRRPSVGLCYSLVCYGSMLGDQGRFDAAHDCFDEALDAIRGAGHQVEASLQCWRSAVLGWQGRWAEAVLAAEQAETVGRRVKSLYLFAMARSLRGYAEWRDSGSEAAIELLVSATRWVEDSGRLHYIALNHGWLTEIALQRGDDAQALQHAEKGLRRTRTGDWLGAAMIARALALRCTAAGDANGAERWLARAERVARRRESAHERANNALCRAEVLAATDPAAAQVALNDAAQRLDTLQMRWHAAQAERLRARIGVLAAA